MNISALFKTVCPKRVSITKGLPVITEINPKTIRPYLGKEVLYLGVPYKVDFVNLFNGETLVRIINKQYNNVSASFKMTTYCNTTKIN